MKKITLIILIAIALAIAIWTAQPDKPIWSGRCENGICIDGYLN